MDAVEDLARLDDPTRLALSQLHQLIATRTVNSRETEDLHGNAMHRTEIQPLPLHDKPVTRATIRRRRLRRLVDPRAAMIAINTDRRQITDPAHMRRLRKIIRIGSQHRILLCVRRHGDQDRIALDQFARNRGITAGPCEHPRRETGLGQQIGFRLCLHRPDHPPPISGDVSHDCTCRISDPENEKLHALPDTRVPKPDMAGIPVRGDIFRNSCGALVRRQRLERVRLTVPGPGRANDRGQV